MEIFFYKLITVLLKVQTPDGELNVKSAYIKSPASTSILPVHTPLELANGRDPVVGIYPITTSVPVTYGFLTILISTSDTLSLQEEYIYDQLKENKENTGPT